KKIWPPVELISLKIVLPKVDLPQPDSPTTPRVFPRSSLKVTSSTAWSIPLGVSKYFIKFLTSSNTFSSAMIIYPPYYTNDTEYSGYHQCIIQDCHQIYIY